jgi:hypothetical protein
VISEFNITIKSGGGCPQLFMPTLYVVALGVNRIGKLIITLLVSEVQQTGTINFWNFYKTDIPHPTQGKKYFKLSATN